MDRNRDKNISEADRKNQPQSPDQSSRQGEQSGQGSPPQPRDQQGQFKPEEDESPQEDLNRDRSNPAGAQSDVSESEAESDLDDLDDARERAQDQRSGLAGSPSGDVEQPH